MPQETAPCPNHARARAGGDAIFALMKFHWILLIGILIAEGCRNHASSHGDTWGRTAPSCRGRAATCGPSGNDDCCESLLVPGGTFYRGLDGVDYLSRDYPATVSDFYLDKYEITVGRLRVFVNAGMGTQKRPPKAGTGAHPKIAGSGWRSAWNTTLPESTAALKDALKCNPRYPTWTDTPGSNENKAVDCLDWYTAFAFCAWDGGRLVTEAEWHYAASGGSEQRYYPWSSPPTSKRVDDSYAVYSSGGPIGMQNVGSKSPKGDGKWGHADLAGNAWEWTLDGAEGPYPMPCRDCAVVNTSRYRNFRGGSHFEIGETLRAADRHIFYADARFFIGARCARDR